MGKGNMNRRKFIKSSLVISAGGVALGAGFLSIEGTSPDELTIAKAFKALDTLTATNLETLGEWDLYQIFSHCAQSIEYSMSGFPQHKSPFFKETAGHIAFSLFAAKGRMTHSLSEPIPGAPALAAGENVLLALARLKNSMSEFSNYTAELAPHFVYGKLTKLQYEQAHVMHLYNHLTESRARN